MANILQCLKVCILLVVIFPNNALASGCQKGQYLAADGCHPCPANTYMTGDDHYLESCFPCRELSSNRDNHATVKRPCTSTSPTIFGCQEGYYRDSREITSEEKCLPCDTCPGQHVGSQCDNFLHNTVCCPSPSMTVIDGKCYPPSSLGNIDTLHIIIITISCLGVVYVWRRFVLG